MDVRGGLQRKKALVEAALKKILPREGDTLAQAMRYAVFSGGKRYRPLLTLAAGDCVKAGMDGLLPFACAIELIHNYSLVHDDLPSMDNDSVRRGQPTCHKAYGEDIALLAGDGLLTLAFEAAAGGEPGENPEGKTAAILELSRAAGFGGMIGGQYLDISRLPEEVDQAYFLELIQKKTGALITAAVRLGGIIGGAGPRQMAALTTYGENVGLAFQTRDDILDQGEDSGKDHISRPNSVHLFGEKETRRRLRAHVAEALGALEREALESEELHYLASLLLDAAEVQKND
jgi:geranylgeranyl diphosphate synthase type II